MVGHGVRTAKGCKRGKVKSLFIRQNTGKNRKSCPLYVGGKVSARLFYTGALSFYIHSLYPGTGKNRD